MLYDITSIIDLFLPFFVQFEADKAVLKALQDACQRQRIPLALSLALQIRTERVIETAITVANHFGRAVVAEALDTILENKRALAAAVQAQQMQGHDAAYVSGSQYSSSEYASEEQDYNHQAPMFDHESSPTGHRKVLRFISHCCAVDVLVHGWSIPCSQILPPYYVMTLFLHYFLS